MTAETEEVWMAADVYGESVLPANAGVYDLLEVMTQLDKDLPLRLDLPLKTGQVVKLLAPLFAVREWRLLIYIGEGNYISANCKISSNMLTIAVQTTKNQASPSLMALFCFNPKSTPYSDATQTSKIQYF